MTLPGIRNGLVRQSWRAPITAGAVFIIVFFDFAVPTDASGQKDRHRRALVNAQTPRASGIKGERWRLDCAGN